MVLLVSMETAILHLCICSMHFMHFAVCILNVLHYICNIIKVALSVNYSYLFPISSASDPPLLCLAQASLLHEGAVLYPTGADTTSTPHPAPRHPTSSGPCPERRTSAFPSMTTRGPTLLIVAIVSLERVCGILPRFPCPLSRQAPRPLCPAVSAQ